MNFPSIIVQYKHSGYDDDDMRAVYSGNSRRTADWVAAKTVAWLKKQGYNGQVVIVKDHQPVEMVEVYSDGTVQNYQ